MKFKAALFVTACSLAHPVFAQDAPAPVTAQAAPEEPESNEVLVTGSRIRQDPNNSALPLQIITNAEVERNGISTPNS